MPPDNNPHQILSDEVEFECRVETLNFTSEFRIGGMSHFFQLTHSNLTLKFRPIFGYPYLVLSKNMPTYPVCCPLRKKLNIFLVNIFT